MDAHEREGVVYGAQRSTAQYCTAQHRVRLMHDSRPRASIAVWNREHVDGVQLNFLLRHLDEPRNHELGEKETCGMCHVARRSIKQQAHFNKRVRGGDAKS